MKVITRAVLDWNGQVLEEDSYEYEGPLSLAKSSGSAPQPVDPYQQAAAQYGLSTGTAEFNAGLNRTNSVNPMGSSMWYVNGSPTGSNPYGTGNLSSPSLSGSGSTQQPTSGTQDITLGYRGGGGGGGAGLSGGFPTSQFGLGGGYGSPATALPSHPGPGSGYGIPAPNQAPNYTQVTQLAPQFQNTLDQPINTAGIAGMPGGPSTTADLQNTRDALYQAQEQYLQPQQALQTEQEKSQLAAQGAMPGSAAYKNEMDQLGRQQEFANNDARMSAITGGGAEQSRLFGLGSQSLQNQIASRNAPLSEWQMLNGTPGGTASAITPDISGAFGQQYQGRLAGYNADVASNNATTSDLASLAMMAFMFSDRRLKEDIKRVGETEGGLPVYTYRYKGSPQMQMGVMAQDAEKEQPGAVFGLGGRDNLKMVDYGAIK